jgi:hypothetical protein
VASIHLDLQLHRFRKPLRLGDNISSHDNITKTEIGKEDSIANYCSYIFEEETPLA